MHTPDTDTRTGLIPEWMRLHAIRHYLIANDLSDGHNVARFAKELLQLATVTYEEN